MITKQDFLQRVKLFLSKDGIIIFLVPNFESWYLRFFKEKWLWYMPPFHLHHFTAKSIGKMAEKQVYNLEEIISFNLGTYTYIVSDILGGLGIINSKNHTKNVDISFKTIKKIDFLFKIAIFPYVVSSRLCKKDVTLLAVLKNNHLKDGNQFRALENIAAQIDYWEN